MAAPPLSPGVPMEGLVSTAPQPEPGTALQPPKPTEAPCETLYIQNLNEKIKPEGSVSLTISAAHVHFNYIYSHETDPSGVI